MAAQKTTYRVPDAKAAQKAYLSHGFGGDNKVLLEGAGKKWHEDFFTKIGNLLTGKGFHGVKELSAGQKALLQDAHALKVAKGDLGSSVKEMGAGFVRIFNPEYRMMASAKGMDAAALKNMKTGVVERAFSKPFRVAANHPRVAIAAAAVAATAWWMGSQNDKKKLAELDAYGPQSGMPSYKNTVSSDEWAAAQSQFRTNDGQPGGFTDRLSAERAAAAQQMGQGA